MKTTVEACELAIAAAIITEGASALAHARSLMSAEDFAGPACRAVVQCADALSRESKPVTAMSVAARGESLGVAESFGGLEGLESIAANNARPGELQAMIKQAAEASGLRKTGERMRKLADYADHPQARENPDRYFAAVAGISKDARARLTSKTVGSLAAVTMYMQELTNRKRRACASPTGLTDLDRMFGGGLQRKRMYVFGARPGVGKSALSIRAMYYGAHAGHPQLMFSCEMPVEDIVQRGACQIANLDSRRINEPDSMLEGDMTGLIRACEKISLMPVQLDCETRELGSMLAQARVWLDTVARPMISESIEAGNGDKVPVIWIDYLQRCHLEGKFSSREEKIGAMSDMLASFARDEGCAIGLLCQLNRSSVRENRRPSIADLRESGSIEQDANVVALIHRDAGAPQFDDESGEPLGEVVEMDAEVIIDKNRHGNPGTVHVTWNGPNGKFIDRRQWGDI